MLKVILQLGQVPEGALVTKPTGTKQYTVRNEIKVSGYGSKETTVLKGEGARYLLSALDIQALPVTAEVAWHVEPETLYHWLTRQLEENE